MNWQAAYSEAHKQEAELDTKHLNSAWVSGIEEKRKEIVFNHTNNVENSDYLKQGIIIHFSN